MSQEAPEGARESQRELESTIASRNEREWKWQSELEIEPEVVRGRKSEQDWARERLAYKYLAYSSLCTTMRGMLAHNMLVEKGLFL